MGTPDLADTLAAIEAAAVHHCGHCDAELGPDSPSKYWCDDECQEAWSEARAEPLVGYREPVDLPEHVNNQREGRSPETTPRGLGPLEIPYAYLSDRNVPVARTGDMSGWRPIEFRNSGLFQVDSSPTEVTFELRVDTSAFDAAMTRLRFATEEIIVSNALDEVSRGSAYRRGSVRWGSPQPEPVTWHMGEPPYVHYMAFDEMPWPGLTVQFNSLRVSTTADPEPPVEPAEGVEFDFDYPTTAVLVEEPQPPVMAPPALDVEALQRLINARSAFVRFSRRFDARGSQ